MEDIGKKALELHRKSRGKLEVRSKVDCGTQEGLSLAYTPGVAAVCREIAKKPEAAYEYTFKWNTVAIVSDGSRVLGLGNIGPLGALPVMEGKAALFKSYGNVDAFPICLSCHTADEIVATVKSIAPSFGGINLEDIESPKCFEVERRLKKELDIPVFHDDQHGTAVVVLAGLINALKVVGRKKEECRVVVGGAGAAGSAVAKLLAGYGFGEVLVCDSRGILVDDGKLPDYKRELAGLNRLGRKGTLADALRGADVFIGASAPNLVGENEVGSMSHSPIIFALSNPVPEIAPDVARKAGVGIYGTARADLPNQVNNVLGFPGIFRGAFLVRASGISEGMKLAAARAIASCVGAERLAANFVVPYAFDKKVVPSVALAVAEEAQKEGIAKLKRSRKELEEELSWLGLL